MDALQVDAGNAGGARRFRPAAVEHRIMLGEHLLDRHVDADVDAAMEGDALALHLLDAAVDEVLLQLEVRDAVAQQPAWLALALIDMHVMAGTAKLLRRGQAGRTGSDDGDLAARLFRRRLRADQAKFIGLVGNRLLDRLDRDRRVLEVQRAGFLARGGADTAGELGEVVGRMQVADRLFPLAAVDEVVPVRNLVVNRTAGRPMAIGNAAIHAARRLLGDLGIRHRNGEFTEMADTVRRWLVFHHLPVDFHETCNLAHVSSPIKAGCLSAPSTSRRSPRPPPVQTIRFR